MHRLKLIGAKYGKAKHVDCTEKLKKLILANPRGALFIDAKADFNTLFGDVEPGAHKTLTILTEYRPGEVVTEVFPETHPTIYYPAVEALKPSYPRVKKPAQVLTDLKEWDSAKGLQEVSASHHEDQLSGASVSIVAIHTAKPLQAMDIGGTSDPYFVCWSDDWPHGAVRTPVIKRTLRPYVDLSERPITFPLTYEALAFLRAGKLSLHVEVWDQDNAYDDFMGYTNIALHYDGRKDATRDIPLHVVDGQKPAGAIVLQLHFAVEVRETLGFKKPHRNETVRAANPYHTSAALDAPPPPPPVSAGAASAGAAAAKAMATAAAQNEAKAKAAAAAAAAVAAAAVPPPPPPAAGGAGPSGAGVGVPAGLNKPRPSAIGSGIGGAARASLKPNGREMSHFSMYLETASKEEADKKTVPGGAGDKKTAAVAAGADDDEHPPPPPPGEDDDQPPPPPMPVADDNAAPPPPPPDAKDDDDFIQTRDRHASSVVISKRKAAVPKVKAAPPRVTLTASQLAAVTGVTGGAPASALAAAAEATATQAVRLNAVDKYATFRYDGWTERGRFNGARSCALNSKGELVVCETDTATIRVVSKAGVIRVLCGGTPGCADGPFPGGKLQKPHGICLDSKDHVIVCDTGNNRIRRVSPDGVISTVAGCGKEGHVDAQGEGAYFSHPTHVCLDPSSGCYLVSDAHAVRMITPVDQPGGGIVSTLAGSNVPGYAEGLGPDARFRKLGGLCVDANTNAIFVCDTGNHRVRAIGASGKTTTLAGTGHARGLDGKPNVSCFASPMGIALDSRGDVLIADAGNRRIRSIARNHAHQPMDADFGAPCTTVVTLAGSGFGSAQETAAQTDLRKTSKEYGQHIQQGPGWRLHFQGCHDVWCDPATGRVFVSDGCAVRVMAPETVPRPPALQPAVTRDKHRGDLFGDAKSWDAHVSVYVAQTAVRTGASVADEGAFRGPVLTLVSVDTLEYLLDKDVGGTSDPYFIVWTDSGRSVNAARKTLVTDTTLTPSLNLLAPADASKPAGGNGGGPMPFPLTNGAVAALRSGSLKIHIEVYDKDVAYDDLMGFTNGTLPALGALEWREGTEIVCDWAVVEGGKPAGSIRLAWRLALDAVNKS